MVRAAMIYLKAVDVKAVNVLRSPAVSEPAPAFEPERAIGDVVTAPLSLAARPQHAAGERVELAERQEPLQRAETASRCEPVTFRRDHLSDPQTLRS
jgi:hypothetical protein